MNGRDHPAAHSMDSAWFAVDETGRVAIFDTGEGGAMPLDALPLWTPDDVDPELEALMLGFFLARKGRAFLEGFGAGYSETDSLVILKDGSVAERLVREGKALRVPSEPGAITTTPKLKAKELTKLKAEGAVEWSANPSVLELVMESPDESLFVVYGNQDYIPGEYTREALPETPVRLDEIPPPLADKITKLPVDFSSADVVQLADFMRDEDCVSWSDDGLRADPAEQYDPPRGSGAPARPLGLYVAAAAVIALVLAWLILR